MAATTNILLASLRTDGAPASLTGGRPTMLAEATPRPAPVLTASRARRSRLRPMSRSRPMRRRAHGVGGSGAPFRCRLSGPSTRDDPERGDAGARQLGFAEYPMQPRPAVAGLYYAAESERSQAGFQKSSGFALLDQSRFLTR